MITNIALWLIANVPESIYRMLPVSWRIWYNDVMYERSMQADDEIPF